MSLQVSIRKKLRGFTLDVDIRQDGGCMGLLGASGSGKSMTLKCIAGVQKPDEGIIRLNGEVLFDSERKICKKPQERNVGILFQNYALFPHMTVEENIGCGVRDRKDRRKKVEEMLERFQLTDLRQRRPGEISGGQQQRVALARMLVGDPGLLMLDEPFSALDAFLREQMHGELQQMIREFSGDVLLVSHNREEIYKFSHKLTVFQEGKTIRTAPRREIFQNPGSVEIARLTGLKNISPYRTIGPGEILALDWNLRLFPEREFPETGYVGVRGHHIIPVADEHRPDGTRRNLYRPVVEDVQEAPFETVFLLRNADGGDRRPLWWMRAENSFRGDAAAELPQLLYIPPEAVMLLNA